MNDPSSPPLNASREHVARTSSGYGHALASAGRAGHHRHCAVLPACGGACDFHHRCIWVPSDSKGVYVLQPNQAAAIMLFGSYNGTDRATGLRWVWPWIGKKKLSARANNMISEKIKVNDLRGNPIEMAAQVVWRVNRHGASTVRRRRLQGVRQGADRGRGAHHRVTLSIRRFRAPGGTLRGNNDQVRLELRTELINRLSVAGITVDDAVSPIWLTLPKLPERCCGASKPKRSWRRARRLSRARSEWWKWRST